jgi:hypothetical protein
MGGEMVMRRLGRGETPHVSDDGTVANMGHPASVEITILLGWREEATAARALFDGRGRLILWLAPDLIEEEVAVALGVGFGL